MDRQAVISEVVVDNKQPICIQWTVAFDHDGSEAQDLAIIDVQLHKVLLWHCRHEVEDRLQRIFPRSEASVWRCLWSRHRPVWERNRLLLFKLDVELFLEVLPSEGISIVDEEIHAIQTNEFTHCKVGDLNILIILQSWDQGPFDGNTISLGHAISLVEDWEVVSAAIQWILLSNLNSVVSQEVQNQEWASLKLRCSKIVNHCKETAYLAVPLEELLHAMIAVSATKQYLIVVAIESLCKLS
mmetsp:Transcript_11597/g.27031  ORF Transcript_11597/g.27031 Transcript_11597/m.27031 type:complete len:242 (-) Transcript_11597:828-1553(-)